MIKRMAGVDVKEGVKFVLSRIEDACKIRIPELQVVNPRLVAVSKTKSVKDITTAYEAGQRHFGENYVQELVEKANNNVILEQCKEIKWHLIGHLQSNKVNKVLSIPNLHVIETVDSKKLALTINKNWPKFGPPSSKLKVMVQVNTSGEEEKSGISPTEAIDCVKFILQECENLELEGLMTIGKYGYDPADGPNPDFLCLKKCRNQICQCLELDWRSLGLSMGMSTDYEQAVELGSTSVRVGSSIFGYRLPKM